MPFTFEDGNELCLRKMPTALQYINEELKKFFGTKLFDLKTNGHNFIIASSLNLAGTENNCNASATHFGHFEIPQIQVKVF